MTGLAFIDMNPANLLSLEKMLPTIINSDSLLEKFVPVLLMKAKQVKRLKRLQRT